ncbi:RNA binding protein fox-1 homolog 3-like isoform X4 [Xyrichtys novacula]|uniref:RNA binding protein fox-1 homolog 3-like isoform X4 n=1 Tax=Xyrichtys novacula TaxID=13765 RepID=A0AAV1GQR9_XYRNO|nr:RNA binding protein fox-1 homolog 3-like isoform X4 [Xyrichtys novacula]
MPGPGGVGGWEIHLMVCPPLFAVVSDGGTGCRAPHPCAPSATTTDSSVPVAAAASRVTQLQPDRLYLYMETPSWAGNTLCKSGSIAVFGNVVYSGLLNDHLWHLGVPLFTRLLIEHLLKLKASLPAGTERALGQCRLLNARV